MSRKSFQYIKNIEGNGHWRKKAETFLDSSEKCTDMFVLHPQCNHTRVLAKCEFKNAF